METDFQFILEAGVNHDGDRDKAFDLVLSAARTGAHFIKFQTYTADKLAAKNSPSYWDLSEESTTSQRELFSKYDQFTKKEYFELAATAEKSGIGFMTTCFDKEWVDELDPVIPQYKIASADITNYQLLAHIASKNKPILISTGASSFMEIEQALNIIRGHSTNEITLLHCVLNYPTSAKNASLDRITEMQNIFPGIAIGYSDHTRPEDSVQAIQIAHSLGARVFEKHFTLDTSGIGNDHYHSFDEAGATQMITLLKKAMVLRNFDENGFLSVQSSARDFARRGIYAARNLSAGHILEENDLIPLRPPVGELGFFGSEFYEIIGKSLNSEVAAGDPILRADLA